MSSPKKNPPPPLAREGHGACLRGPTVETPEGQTDNQRTGRPGELAAGVNGGARIAAKHPGNCKKNWRNHATRPAGGLRAALVAWVH